ncbi:MAG TPA: hypothetical protein VMD78_10750 [Candidatus Baltobacteraceae bacterium]|nr:hypothetical protein [Candidatus Baltobacteraceae bacterium]
MRGIGSVIGLLMVVVISLVTYKYFLASGPSADAGASTPVQTIDAVGAQNDLIAIAQAERMYQAQNGKYAPLDDLVTGGVMNFRKPSRRGYTYEVEASDTSFRATAQCTSDQTAGCHSYSIDPTMNVQIVP